MRFLVTELHSKEGTALRVAFGVGVPQGHPPTRVFYSQVHDRGWSCEHGRYIRMSVTQLVYSQVPVCNGRVFAVTEQRPLHGRYMRDLNKN